jgi:hypothetical protein
MTTEQKIKRFHFEEIMLILFICSADLSNYDHNDLVCFAEDIEGRVEVLFEKEYLLGFTDRFQITPDILNDFQSLKEFLTSLYASSWHRKMKDKAVWAKANVLSSELLKKLNVGWVEPNAFKETHLDIDWI